MAVFRRLSPQPSLRLRRQDYTLFTVVTFYARALRNLDVYIYVCIYIYRFFRTFRDNLAVGREVVSIQGIFGKLASCLSLCFLKLLLLSLLLLSDAECCAFVTFAACDGVS